MKKLKNIFSRSFFEGMFSLNIFPLQNNPEIKKILKQTDGEAIASDWKKIGNNLKKAMGIIK